MIIKLNKKIISLGQFKLKCSIGKGGIKKKIREGDKITPKGTYYLSDLYYRPERIKKFKTRIKWKKIKKNMGWCDDPNSKDYNRLIYVKKKHNYSFEKLFRKDRKYDLIIPIKYNFNKPLKDKGSAIFFHLTEDFKPTNGCIALEKKDFFILLKFINKYSKIKIF